MQRYRSPQGFTCPITGKKGYPTEEAAERARVWLKSHDRTSVKGRHQLETYGPAECCGQFHHTSSRPRILVDA
jgi:hypothetical protein